jgi:hypothetical protein
LDRSTLFPSTGLDTGIIIIRTIVPKHFVRYAASVLRQDYDLATQRCARIATQIEENEVKILWIGHKIGEILGNIGVK